MAGTAPPVGRRNKSDIIYRAFLGYLQGERGASYHTIAATRGIQRFSISSTSGSPEQMERSDVQLLRWYLARAFGEKA